jgi:tetratricopeptide (TPR) repeat protein
MEPKDIAAITLSILAFGFSIVSFLIGYRRAREEQRRWIRQQLTETIDKITDSQLEGAKLMFGEARDNLPMQQTVNDILGQRTLALLHQAIYLTSLPLAIATEVDYNTIAFVSANYGDMAVAETNYHAAINASPNDSFRSGAIRSYAAFLFAQGRFDDGRRQFKDALALIKRSDDLAKMQRGFICQTWGMWEANCAAVPNQATEALDHARSEYTAIDNEAMRQSALARLGFAGGPQVPPMPQMFQPGATPGR